MGWVVIGHVMSFGLGSSINAPTVYPHYLNRTIFLFVEGGILAVDVFFYVGGFLVAYALLRNKPSSSAGYLLGILQRALRLWPSYLVAIMILYGLFMHMGYGPLW
jgi:peptidoglycan/LPS O-acetylase OafA/YrhL